jgi:hypothetical protein
MNTMHPFIIKKAKYAKGASFGFDPDPEAFYVFLAHTNSEVAGPFETYAEARTQARRMEK